jgi:Erythromycin esterase/Phosphoribosyl transferase domain
VVVLNDDIVRDLRIPPDQIQQAVEREGRELVRCGQAYREGRPMPALTGRTVILVDDGLATGAALRAAVQAVHQHQPGRLVVALPAAPESTCRDLLGGADEVVCATTPAGFSAVGESYWEAAPLTDEDVRDVLRAAAGPTEFALRQETNLGQLVRERHPGESRLIGLTTYTGTVAAAEDWGGPVEPMRVRPARPALPDSVDELFHETGAKDLFLPFPTSPRSTDVLRSARLERAIGFIYRPQTERDSHSFRARLADQYDAVIHIDDTRAVEPLERTARWAGAEPAETYPAGV